MTNLNTFFGGFWLLTLCIACGLTLCISCNSKNSDTASNSTTVLSGTENIGGPPGAQSLANTAVNSQNVVFPWVNPLNIRKAPNTNSEIVASARENESLTLTGEKSAAVETIELRGKSYTEPWVQVKTAQGVIGWVFGGAVKKAGEEKGNALNTAQKFTYPYFGTFDLSAWHKTGTRDDGSDDNDATTTIYKKDQQTLEITKTAKGEYYWGNSYTLLAANKTVLKSRTIGISFGHDPDAGHTLTETVKDYTSDPPMEYIRSVKLDKKTYEKNPEPDMASGLWEAKKMQ